jgi:hypothetical protein
VIRRNVVNLPVAIGVLRERPMGGDLGSWPKEDAEQEHQNHEDRGFLHNSTPKVANMYLSLLGSSSTSIGHHRCGETVVRSPQVHQ